MCYNGKCGHFLEVETGSLIFAILNVMVTSLGTVISLGGLMYTIFVAQAAIREVNELPDEGLMEGVVVFGLAGNVVFAALAVCFGISFSFAVVLLVGLCKRKANLVKCYFVYGMMKIVFGVATVFGLAINSCQLPVVFFLFIIQFLYALILIMVRLTFRKFEGEVQFHAFSNPMATVQKF